MRWPVEKLLRAIVISVLPLLVGVFSTLAEEKKPLILDYSDTFEIVRGLTQDTIYISGSVAFSQGGGKLFADSAIWLKGNKVILNGHVDIKDSTYQLLADRVIYDIRDNLAFAYGKKVTIISERDSLMAVGTDAYYSRDSSLFRMANRSTVYLNNPDSARLIQVDADRIAFNGKDKVGYADGNVDIKQGETVSHSGRAIMYGDDNVLALYEKPTARRKDSDIKGDTLILFSEKRGLKRIFVEGNADGNFKEPSSKDSSIYDVSELKGSEINFNLDSGALNNIVASGQAYSFYQPGTKDSSEVIKNNASGDTIKLFIASQKLDSVKVIGGVEGEYLTGKYKMKDTMRVFTEDTVAYKSDFIDYTFRDSTITMVGKSSVQNKNVSLTAYKVKYNTAREFVTAFDDSTRVDTTLVYIPVILKDGTEELLGSYLEYSLKTEKGLLWKSKSEYQSAYYRGKELYREKKDEYYVDDGSYTSCNLDEPHYHFQSSKMKMLQGNKIIARPVVFYIDKMPIMIAPYYIFSIRPGRHSGFLPFRFGNFERGAGSISNVGYYWAASQYWDVLASLDYYENFGLSYNGTVRYAVRYKLSGTISGSYANETDIQTFREVKGKRWRLYINHSQTFSPTFDMKADGTFLSDKKYYTDFSTNLNDRLDRNLRSDLSFSKRWGSSALTAEFQHLVALDQNTRTDVLPTASFSLPARQIFKSPAPQPGQELSRKWYQNFYFGYGVNLRNFSYRATDTATGHSTRKKYLVVNHSPSLTMSPFNLFKYIRIGPGVQYQETWYKIYRTDQSDSVGINAAELYRRYSYSASLSAATDLYGTVYPHLWGLEGLRHVITPSVAFSFAPEITQHNDIRNYTGAGGGGARQRTLSFSLGQLLQAKVKSGEGTKNLDLLSIQSSVSYNFEATGQKFSSLITSMQTSLLKRVNMSASVTHSLYVPGTNQLRWWSPYLTHLDISTSFSLGGTLGSYTGPDTSGGYPAAPGGGQPSAPSAPAPRQSWTLSVSHYFAEDGRGAAYNKIHNVSVSVKFNLTKNWQVGFWQTYDIAGSRTLSKRIEIQRNLHCWQGYFYWVPDGSNKGYYFRLNVLSIPDIKFEKSESGLRGLF